MFYFHYLFQIKQILHVFIGKIKLFYRLIRLYFRFYFHYKFLVKYYLQLGNTIIYIYKFTFSKALIYLHVSFRLNV